MTTFSRPNSGLSARQAALGLEAAVHGRDNHIAHFQWRNT
jgi:hypothetical protein